MPARLYYTETKEHRLYNDYIIAKDYPSFFGNIKIKYRNRSINKKNTTVSEYLAGTISILENQEHIFSVEGLKYIKSSLEDYELKLLENNDSIVEIMTWSDDDIDFATGHTFTDMRNYNFYKENNVISLDDYLHMISDVIEYIENELSNL